jgi:peptide/nickel transport system substrate-binding protein
MSDKLHPYVDDARGQLANGRISRREFLRLATLVGMSLPAAQVLAGCAPAATATQAPATSAVKRGGTLKVALQIPAADHPARFSWVTDSNVCRHAYEYLSITARDNVTRPYLLESWTPNAELTQWTLKLRSGVKWSNGDDLVADHVLFNFKEWLNPDVGSSILGLWEGFLTVNDVEVVDSLTLRLNLKGPKLDVPENLFHYPAQIMHPSFDGDITTGKNPGTGPYTLKEYKVGERARLERREGYWQNGADGQALPYLDAIEYIDVGEDPAAFISAMQGGQVNAISGYHSNTPEIYLALKDDSKFQVIPTPTSQVRVLRMRVDVAPWDNNDIRTALKKTQDRKKILGTAYFGQGVEGHDTHISPVHPEFAPMDVPAYDPEGAKALLSKNGLDSLDLKIAVGTGWTDIVSYIQTMKEDAKAANINIELDSMPNNAYWDLWTEAAVGVTPWTHRPLAVMVLPLAYIADSEGKPVPWNESRWVDAEFSTLIAKAQGLADLEARRAVMKDLQRIQMERGSVGIAYWMSVWGFASTAVKGFDGHPTGYDLWNEVWLDQ